jgi:hypothetical protein
MHNHWVEIILGLLSVLPFVMVCPPSTIVKACDFVQNLVDQQPVYDKLILEDMTPVDGWVGNMTMGTFESYSGVEHTLDRFTDVFPDVTKVWTKTQSGNCLGTPCDKTRHTIGVGAKRSVYFLEEQSWKTPLFCFDQDMHITHAKEHFAQIISKILKPVTSWVMGSFMRKRALLNAGRTWAANKTVSTFTFVFSLGPLGNEEIYFDCSVAPNIGGTDVNGLGLLTPQMLQRRFEPLMRIGYAGQNPFKETAPFIELVTDISTCWSLDRLGGSVGVGGGNNPTVVGNWRFEQWGATEKYWRYGYSGQLGNFMVRTDEFSLRFNFLSDLGAAAAPNRYRYQVVEPYVNVVTSGAGGAPGLGRVNNDSYDLAQFGISFIWHKKAMEALVADATPVNSQMPFSSRNFGGKWQFVMDNLGADQDGKVIENFLRNKGMFVADFKLSIRPMYTEFCEGIFHKREPQCVYVIQPCNPDPGYPAQSYNSANATCAVPAFTILLTPILSLTKGTYEIPADTFTCDNAPVNHAAITGTSTLAALVAQLNLNLGTVGTWTVVGAQIQLVTTSCAQINPNFTTA